MKSIFEMPDLFKYLLLIVAALVIICCCSLFQHVIPVAGEYHYSYFFGKNYTIPVAIIFLFLVSV
ncbi:MAG: hypothetical protein M3015_08850 [Bacteroidota bacterium]|nr:hypothetical protein [Bacteroidota bacterium]